MAKKTVPQRWTIVQHSGFGYGGHASFERGVESRRVDTQEDQIKVVKAGGLLFETYEKAEGYVDEEPYLGQDVKSLCPCVQGTFSEHKIDNLRIYIPKPGK